MHDCSIQFRKRKHLPVWSGRSRKGSLVPLPAWLLDEQRNDARCQPEHHCHVALTARQPSKDGEHDGAGYRVGTDKTHRRLSTLTRALSKRWKRLASSLAKKKQMALSRHATPNTICLVSGVDLGPLIASAMNRVIQPTNAVSLMTLKTAPQNMSLERVVSVVSIASFQVASMLTVAHKRVNVSLNFI